MYLLDFFGANTISPKKLDILCVATYTQLNKTPGAAGAVPKFSTRRFQCLDMKL
jgi:hypothetical protein